MYRRRREAVGMHESVTASSQPETVHNTVNNLRRMKSKYDVTPQTAYHFVDLVAFADQKPLNIKRIPTITKKVEVAHTFNRKYEDIR